MRLIDADALMEGEVLYRIPPNDINNAPTVDPIHAAGGCYCREDAE